MSPHPSQSRYFTQNTRGEGGAGKCLSRQLHRHLRQKGPALPNGNSNPDTVILGAGAAGLFCAAEAGRRGRKVVVLDHADRPGRKILISGGGRCNFTNLHTEPENFLSANPHFARSSLARYTPHDFLALVEQHRIPWHEKTLGQLFCDRSAQDIVTLLERECAGTGNVHLQLGTRVLAATHTGTEFLISTERNGQLSDLRASTLVVATGGLSIPKIGATGIGYEIAQHFGLPIVPTRPALVPLTLAPPDLAFWSEIAGVSTEVIATVSAGRNRDRARRQPSNRSPRSPLSSGTFSQAERNQQRTSQRNSSHCATPEFRDKLLFTHRGLSGPAILQASSYLCEANFTLALDLAPDQTPFADPELAPRSAAAAADRLRSVLPARLADRWLAQNAPDRWSNTAIAALEQYLHSWQLQPSGTEGYSKAEVTAGGVDTGALDPRTLEARAVPGLFFIGEVVDVTGWLGGYNFQWAWASAAAAGRSL